MKDFKHIESQVEKTLRSIDAVKQASPGPFFFTRVQARLNRTDRTIWDKLSVLLSKPTVAIAGICLIIFVNTVTVLDIKETLPTLAEQSEPIYDDEYSMAVTSFYDIENTEP